MAGIEVRGLDAIMLVVGDLDQARAFYEAALGLPVTFISSTPSIASLGLGPHARLLLCAQTDGNSQTSSPAGSSVLWLEVADVRAAVARLAKQGIMPATEPQEIDTGWVVEIADPWGNIIGLSDYAKVSSSERLDLASQPDPSPV